jgi:hypothetical protein
MSFKTKYLALKEKIKQLSETKGAPRIELIGSSVEKEEIKNEFGYRPGDILHNIVRFAGIKSGDFWICYNGKLLYFFERKTLADLSASIKDGRWKSQKFKMEQMPILPERTYYLVEDLMSLEEFSESKKGKHALGPDVLGGAQENAIVRDNRRILRTINTRETVYMLLLRVRKLYEFGPSYYEEELRHYPVIPDDFDPLNPSDKMKKFIDRLGKLVESRRQFTLDFLSAAAASSTISSASASTSTSTSTSAAAASSSVTFNPKEVKEEKKITKRKIESSSSSSDDDSSDDEEKEEEEKEEEKKMTKLRRDHVKSKKKNKGIISAQQWYFACLADIQGMGNNDKTIIAKFPKYHQLLRFCLDEKMTEKEKIKTLTNLPVPSTNMVKKKGARTKLGPAIAQKVYEWINF